MKARQPEIGSALLLNPSGGSDVDDDDARVKASYGDNYERLAAIKKKYDPKNLFRVNRISGRRPETPYLESGGRGARADDFAAVILRRNRV